MQQQQSYAGPYYSQNAYFTNQIPYDGAGPNNNFTPYWSSTTQYPAYLNTPFYQPQGAQQQQQQQPQKTYTLDKPGRPFRPFKTSLKRHETLPAPQPNQPTRRKRATSNPQQAPKMEAPDPAETPSRMFISFVGTDEIQIEHLSKPAMAEIRNTIFNNNKEWPHGIALDELKDLVWRVKFNNAPWCIGGPSTDKAWDMLLSLFTRFSQRGYAFHTSISIGSSAPRLIFLASELDLTSRFFFVHPSNGGRKLIFIKPPTEIKQHLPNLLLRTNLSGHIDFDLPEDQGITTFSVELKKGLYTARAVSPGHLLVIILRTLESFNVQLETAIPLARKGPLSKLGVGPRPELLLFKVFAKQT
ncbi:hypothetical protein Moror_9697 [Moniliophthora roreri MCA 2997]|uniref:Uncharacterized protein n=1 Tax=Moniliophthora roreri (strain MCA 2997) TaxID=1381753 RepID=V2X1K0_MONRO|nr:hypothetical protein Moror_9697 [Moniliophthora roreri MCA 2997]